MLPRPALFWLFVLAGAPFLIPMSVEVFAPFPDAWTVILRQAGILANMLIFVVALLDLAITPSLRRIEVQREFSEVMSVGARNVVRIWFLNRNHSTLWLEVHDDPPAPCLTEGLPYEIELPRNRQRYRAYHVEPQHRGPNQFGQIDLRCTSRLGLWTLCDERVLPEPVRVYPDIQAVYGMELLARRNRLAETGFRMSQIRGRGNDFDRLREYRREDEYRNIDWKATARHQELISREYVVERNQNILFVLDCGRSMCNELDGISHLDRALNAAIALSYVALRQGDNISFLAFAGKMERWVRHVRGTSGLQAIIRNTYDLEPRYEASDYGVMVEEVRRRFRKRGLVILLTHALDEVHLQNIAEHIQGLRRPHLVLGAFLRNVPLEERLEGIPRTEVESFQVAAAAEMIAAQTLQIAELQGAGLLVMDTLPEQLSSDLISRYLDIKARNLL